MAARVQTIFREPNRRILISRLTVAEMHSVFARRVRMGDLTAADGAALRSRLLGDVAAASLLVLAVTDRHYAETERLLVQHGNAKRLRTLDALQLAVALDAHRRGALDSIVAADNALCEVATAEGLPTETSGFQLRAFPAHTRTQRCAFISKRGNSPPGAADTGMRSPKAVCNAASSRCANPAASACSGEGST